MPTELDAIASLPPMTDEIVDRVRLLEQWSMVQDQLDLPVSHFLHGGMYSRTIMIPAGVMITGAFIIIETVLVVSGHVKIYTGKTWCEYTGYNVLPAAARRKQIFIALSDVYITMFFPTDAKTVKDAEERFTNEFSKLQNRES